MKDSGSPSSSAESIHTFPELAEALSRSAPHITRTWESRARQRLQGQDELTFNELAETLPQLVQQLAELLASGHEPSEPLANPSNHAMYRFRGRLNLPGLFVGYDLLQTVVIGELAGELNRGLKTDEVLAICTGTEVAVRGHLLAFIEHTKREFQAVSQARSMYLSYIAHDLRSGLNSVVMLTELLGEQLAGHQQFESSLADLKLIRSNIQDTVAAMNRFLKGEQIRNKKIVPRITSTNLRELIETVVAQFEPEARARGLDLVSNAPKEAMTETDGELVLLILQNVISNAVRYSNKGTIEIIAAQESNSWKLSVRDEGPGIPQNRLDEMFQPFTRGETFGHPGIGLGLSIAMHAAEALQAKLSAESKPGEGTTFCLHLPT